jgi:hypothetical protein
VIVTSEDVQEHRTGEWICGNDLEYRL